MPAFDLRPADEGRHLPGTDDLWGESWYHDFAAADDKSAMTSVSRTSTPITRWPAVSMRRRIAPPIPPAEPVTAMVPNGLPSGRPA